MIKHVLLVDFKSDTNTSDFPTKINSICAQLLNVSRQNIEKIRTVGFFDKIRVLEKLVLDYMKNEYKEK